MNCLFILGGVLISSLVLTIKSLLHMLEKYRIFTFMPFFIIGLSLCLISGFLFYDFFDIALDIYLIIKLFSVVGMFFVLWRALK